MSTEWKPRLGLEKRVEKFFEKAKKVHGDRYDYSQTVYEKSNRKIKIICRKHETFEQEANSHLQGHGCSKCCFEHLSDLFRKHQEKFIQEAREKHGDKYDYSKVDYKKNDAKVIIICKIHGEFSQTPADHFRSNGCERCGRIAMAEKQRNSPEEVIQRCKNVHGDKFDYSESVYNGYHTHMNITCKKHGKFLQSPANHIAGKGCSRCKAKTVGERCRKDPEQFIAEAVGIHNDIYDYSETKYETVKEKVKIICKKHGSFGKPRTHI